MESRRAVDLFGAVVVSMAGWQGQCLDPYPEDVLWLMAVANSGICAMVHVEGLPTSWYSRFAIGRLVEVSSF
jgi:hypothetical protein